MDDQFALEGALNRLAVTSYMKEIRGTSSYGPTGDTIECSIRLAQEHGWASVQKFIRHDREAAEALVS